MKKDENGFIDELEANEIFVFGSNISGLHSGGAAILQLHDHFGLTY